MPEPGPIGRNVRRLRERQGWSQNELARRSGVSQPFVNQLESGRSAQAQGSVLQALARALGCTVDELLREQAEG